MLSDFKDGGTNGTGICRNVIGVSKVYGTTVKVIVQSIVKYIVYVGIADFFGLIGKYIGMGL